MTPVSEGRDARTDRRRGRQAYLDHEQRYHRRARCVISRMLVSALHMSLPGTSQLPGDVRLESAKWDKADVEPTSPSDRVWTHLRHHRAIFAVMHSGVLPQRYGNVRPQA